MARFLGCECCRWRQGRRFFYARDAAAEVVFFYAQDAAAEVAEWARVAAVRFLGWAMVGRLWGVWQVVELGLALAPVPVAFFLWGCCALPCFRQGQTPGGV